MVTGTRFEQAALDYAEVGYHIFPLRERRKEPLTGTGFKAATRDERQLLQWWDAAPNANIGVACGASGIVVLDIYSKAGADPDDVLGDVDIGDAPVVRTGEAPERSARWPRSLAGVRGAQVFFRGTLRTTDKIGIPGAEIRGVGAYVLVPPSVHPSGVEYQGTLPPVAELPPVPGWLAESVQRHESRRAEPVGDVIPKGEQHRKLVSLAGTMRRRGMGVDEIEAALLVTNAKRLEDPAPRENIRRIAESVCRYPPGSSNGNSEGSGTNVTNGTHGTNGSESGGEYEVGFDAKGKLQLPPPPAPDDMRGHCAWLTAAFNLDPGHPITRGERHGLAGPAGLVVLHRRDAPPIEFEPVSRITAPLKLSETLHWSLIPSDGAPYGYKLEHAAQVAHVVRMLCGATAALTSEQETLGILASFEQSATRITGLTTYGPGAVRYEAAKALSRDADGLSGHPVGPPRYLIDTNTGELVMRVADLTAAARHHLGCSVPRGWLDARMAALGWERIRLDGHQGGRGGAHARCVAYRGVIAGVPDA